MRTLSHNWGLQVRHATAHVHNLLQLSFAYVIARCNFLARGARARARASVIRPDREQPIKEPSLKYYNHFLLFNISSLIRDPNISLVKVYWKCDWGFILPFAVKLRGIIFLRQLTVDE